MNPPPRDIFEELRALSARIDDIGPDHPDRAALEQRREELRAAARRAHLAARDPQELRGELAHLRARRARLEGEKIRIPLWQERTGGLINDPAASSRRINRLLDEANAPEMVSIERRISEIEEILLPGRNDTAPD